MIKTNILILIVYLINNTHEVETKCFNCVYVVNRNITARLNNVYLQPWRYTPRHGPNEWVP